MFHTEVELVNRLLKHYKSKLIYTEIGVGYGISDLLIVRNKSELEKFISSRNGVKLNTYDEIKVFDYIRKRAGVTIDELSTKTYISKNRLKYSILNQLISIGAIEIKENKLHRVASFTLFPINSIAIEAKLEDWNKGIAQAIRYQRFAQKTYLAIDERYKHRVNLEEFLKFNVGLITVGSKVKELISPNLQIPSDPIMRYKVAEEIILRNNITCEMHH